MKLHARLLAVAFAMISMPAWTQLYQITDLGSLGGNAISPTSVNDNAQVTGSGTTAFSNFTQAFFYSNGQLRNISPLGSTQSVAVAINSRGKITGTFIDSNSGHRAFLYDTTSGQMQDIGEHPGEWGEGRGINDSGQITGYALEQNGVHPYIYSQGTLHFLGALGNSGSAGYAINASGQITGSSTSPGGSRTFIYDFNSGVTQDLGTLGGTGSNGNDINDSGQVTGSISFQSGSGTYYHAFLYTSGIVRDLGTLGGISSYGMAINNSGHVVGAYRLSSGDWRAFLFKDNVMRDLNSLIDPANSLAPFVTLNGAVDISNSGLIVASGMDSRVGQVHGYLLSPSPPIVTPLVTGALGMNGWYTSDVMVNWNAVDYETPVTSPPCTITTLSANTAGTTVTCSATSPGGTTTTSVQVKIDKSVPACTATLSPSVLSVVKNPHKLVKITATVSRSAAGASGPATVSLYSVVSSEPDRGLATDDLPGDIVGWKADGGQLRAEAYSAAGRTYTATFRVTNPAGRSSLCASSVLVR